MILSDKPKIYKDTRLAGVEKYILTDDPTELMFVPPEVKRCVAFIGYVYANNKKSLEGTAFFVSRQGSDATFTYAVTAKHIIDGAKTEAKKVFLRLNYHDGKYHDINVNLSRWIGHPSKTEYVDVSLCEFPFEPEYDHEAIPYKNIDLKNWPTLNGVPASDFYGDGDEVFFPGLFWQHHGTKKNIPIIRTGNIAAMRHEPVRIQKHGLIDAYLIEARSIGGLSGSPVFAHVTSGSITTVTNISESNDSKDWRVIRDPGLYMFMGLVHGHYNDPRATRDDVNAGMAIVIPSEKILEVLDQKMITDKEKAEDEKLQERRLPTPDRAGKRKVKADITQEGFEDALKKASRKISSPDEEKKET